MNVMLCILMLYLSPVDVWWTYLYLTLSLLYIYSLDHYRFLRCTQGGIYADKSMDNTAQYMCAVPCALIAGSLAVRLEKHGLLGVGRPLLLTSAVIALHLILHVGILAKIVPTMHEIWAARKKRSRSNPHTTPANPDTTNPDTTSYKEVASHVACSWFNASPVHCLRSKFIYNHDPPCTYFVRGKEHLMRTNESVGMYFHPPAPPKLKIKKEDLE